MSQIKVEWVYPEDCRDAPFVDRIPVVRVSALTEVVERLRDGYTGDFSAYRWALNDLLAHLDAVIPKQDSGSEGKQP